MLLPRRSCALWMKEDIHRQPESHVASFNSALRSASNISGSLYEDAALQAGHPSSLFRRISLFSENSKSNTLLNSLSKDALDFVRRFHCSSVISEQVRYATVHSNHSTPSQSTNHNVFHFSIRLIEFVEQYSILIMRKSILIIVNNQKQQ